MRGCRDTEPGVRKKCPFPFWSTVNSFSRSPVHCLCGVLWAVRFGWFCTEGSTAAAAVRLGEKRKLHVLLYFQRNAVLGVIVWGNLIARCCCKLISQFCTYPVQHVGMDFLHKDTRLPKVSTIGWNASSSSLVVTVMSICHWQGTGSLHWRQYGLGSIPLRFFGIIFLCITFIKRTVSFICVIRCIVILRWRSPTRCSSKHIYIYLYCCTVRIRRDNLIIPTNALT